MVGDNVFETKIADLIVNGHEAAKFETVVLPESATDAHNSTVIKVEVGSKYLYIEHVTVPPRKNTTEMNKIFDQILSTFTFLDNPTPTTPPSTSVQTNGAELKDIHYALPAGWGATMNADNLHLAPKSGGGYLYIEAFNYPGTTGRREYFCGLHKYCIAETVFTETPIGNIAGYKATKLDNSGGGEEYFGAKGNKFYIISTYSPPSPNDFDTNFQSVLSSLIF